MILCRDFFYLSADGQTNIHAVQWAGEEQPRAVIQIAHGICEYIERYDHFARWLAERGFVVVGNDHLGHGKSWQEPARQGLFREKDGWDTVLCDMETLRRMTAEQYPGVPYILLGHSMADQGPRPVFCRHHFGHRTAGRKAAEGRLCLYQSAGPSAGAAPPQHFGKRPDVQRV